MGLVSWLKMIAEDDKLDFPTPAVFEEDQPLSQPATPENGCSLDLSPDDIADQLELYCRKVDDNAAKVMQLLEILRKRDTEIIQLKTSLLKLQEGNAGILRLNKAHQVEISQLRDSQLSMQQRLQAHAQTNTALQKHNDHLETVVSDNSQKMQDMQLDIECLKCTKPTTRPAEATSLINPQPFVAVLVDGDAYSWSSDIIVQASGQSPGALAASRLKSAVTRYILDNSIHPSCKIVTKVYLNGTATVNANTNNTRKPAPKGSNNKAKMQQPKYQFATFGQQFAGAMPLFDIIDVGHGKERADEKIRENFHLLISNPLCHAIFLAACTDNGFARMLSPYQYNREAYDKIILVSPGYVETEIANLGFRDMTWSSVFANKSGPGPKGVLIFKEKEKNLAQQRVRKQMAWDAEQEQQRELLQESDRRVEWAQRIAGNITPSMLDSMKVGDGKRLLERRRLGVRMMSAPVVPKAAVLNEDEWEDDID